MGRVDAPVALVETPGDHPGLFDVRQLVLADGNQIGLAEQDVGGLVHREGQHQPGHGTVGRGQLVLDGRVAAQLRVGDQSEEGQHQLVQGGHCRMGEDDRPLGIDPSGQVVGHHVVDVVLQLTDAVAVVDHLVVGHDQEGFDAGVLQPHPVLERTEVVPDVQPAGGAVPRQQPEPGRI